MCTTLRNQAPERPADAAVAPAPTPQTEVSMHDPQPASTQDISATTSCTEYPDAKRQAWLSARLRHPALGMCRR